MTSAAFTFFLRFLVLVGLFSASLAHAVECRVGNNAWVFPDPVSACMQAAPLIAGAGAVGYYNNAQCEMFSAANSPVNIALTCTCPVISEPKTPVPTTLVQASPLIFDGSVVPQTGCQDRCVVNLDQTASTTFGGVNTGGYSCRSANVFGSISGLTPTTPVGHPLICDFQYVRTGSTCNMVDTCPVGSNKVGAYCVPSPRCTSPQQLNAQNICETPACPSGQVRETSLGQCKPIVCTLPLVKEGNQCVLPSCPTGETYEYKDGAGQCLKNAPLCVSPMVNYNGVCKLPTCPTGMVLDTATQSCKLNPATNNTNPMGNGTNTGSSGTSSGTGTNTPTTPIPSAGTGATGTGASTGTTATTSPTASPSGTASNTSGSGLCKTAPCGSCDPSKEACGNTFGGSCKGDFQCNGDAIQCAVALATNKSECATQSLKVDTELDLAYVEGKAAYDAGTKALGQPNGGIPVINGGSITIDSTNPFSSSCPSDMQLFEYKGTAYVFPLSKYCNIFNIIGGIMLLIASIISMKIIMKQE